MANYGMTDAGSGFTLHSATMLALPSLPLIYSSNNNSLDPKEAGVCIYFAKQVIIFVKKKLSQMNEKLENFDDLTDCIYATLNVAGKDGCSLSEVEKSFRIDWRHELTMCAKKFQFANIQKLLEAMPEKVELFKCNGKSYARAVSIEKCAKATQLIEEVLHSNSRYKKNRQHNVANAPQNFHQLPRFRCFAIVLSSPHLFPLSIWCRCLSLLQVQQKPEAVVHPLFAPLLSSCSSISTARGIPAKVPCLMMLASVIHDLCREYGNKLPLSFICGIASPRNSLCQAGDDIIISNKKVVLDIEASTIHEELKSMNVMMESSQGIRVSMVLLIYVINVTRSSGCKNLDLTFVRSSSMELFVEMNRLLKDYLEIIDLDDTEDECVVPHRNEYFLFIDAIVKLCRVRVLEVIKRNEVKVECIDSGVQYLVTSDKKLLPMPPSLFRFPAFAIHATFESNCMEQCDNVKKMEQLLEKIIVNRTEVAIVVKSALPALRLDIPKKFLVQVYLKNPSNPGASPVLYPSFL
uniref:DUF7515 domain-containing protein n=1 Tax=Ditylenchus dipsaci TaxID=166011 RepID=A0A915E9C6_9BILA